MSTDCCLQLDWINIGDAMATEAMMNGVPFTPAPAPAPSAPVGGSPSNSSSMPPGSGDGTGAGKEVSQIVHPCDVASVTVTAESTDTYWYRSPRGWKLSAGPKLPRN